MKKAVFCTIIIVCALSIASCEDAHAKTDGISTVVGVFSPMEEDDPSPAVSQTEEAAAEADVELLIHLVASEAGGFPYMTQVCFAAMVLNRVEDPYFPRGIRGVIFESGDFTSVLSGKVTGTLPEDFEETRKYRISKKAVAAALGGLDPTNGALYFSTAAGKSSAFTPSFECGGMSFGF